ncbi:MAG: hypothetical protein HY544_01125 [Candidatus Diapherotrites archaeon]|uniref:Uncharacterized protein n=1 Tax=Candidatus Iainarchaeum sp. TaxID=3101447 RepID=A0A8T3YHT0_9ARCH|nr:hypothetical protein [Candidatus Diapherotrites archaeon]
MAINRFAALFLVLAFSATAHAYIQVSIESGQGVQGPLYPFEVRDYSLLIDNNSGVPRSNVEVAMRAGDGVAFVLGGRQTAERYFTLLSMRPYWADVKRFSVKALPGFSGDGMLTADVNDGEGVESYIFYFPVDSNGLDVIAGVEGAPVPSGERTLSVSLANSTAREMTGIVAKVLPSNGYAGVGELMVSSLAPGESVSGKSLGFSFGAEKPRGPVEVAVFFDDSRGAHRLEYGVGFPGVQGSGRGEGNAAGVFAAISIAVVLALAFMHFNGKKA